MNGDGEVRERVICQMMEYDRYPARMRRFICERWCKMARETFCPGNLQKQLRCSFVFTSGDGDESLQTAHARVPGRGVSVDVGSRISVVAGLVIVHM